MIISIGSKELFVNWFFENELPNRWNCWLIFSLKWMCHEFRSKLIRGLSNQAFNCKEFNVKEEFTCWYIVSYKSNTSPFYAIIQWVAKCNARFIKNIGQLKSDIWSCRCKNFSRKQTSALIGGSGPPGPSIWIRHCVLLFLKRRGTSF